MAEFDLNNLFNKAFGYQPPEKFKVDDEAPAKAVSGSFGSSYYALDMLGREMFMPVTFYGVAEGEGNFQYVVPFAVMSVNCKKIIVSTPMPQRGGSVKELISLDDYSINIKGIVISDDNSFPEAEIKIIQNIFLVNQSIRIRSVLADIFLKKDQRVVIKEIKWPAVAGTENARPFEMECESDSIFDLINVDAQ